MSTNWNELIERHEIAYLKGDLATSSPESYTVEEMKEISDSMFASTAEVEAALRDDFQSMPPEAQGKMLDLLKQADSDNFTWWVETLVGLVPDSVAQIS